MLIPDSGNGFFVDLAQQFQRRLAREQLSVVVLSSDDSNDQERLHLNLLGELGVEGVVFIGARFHMPTYQELGKMKVPVLVLDRDIPVPGPTTDSVMLDNAGGIRQVLEHLVSLGHHRVLHIQGAMRTEPGRVRSSAFEEGAASYSLDARTTPGDFTFLAGRDAVRRVFVEAADPWRPTAIVAGNDLSAVGAIQELRRLGLSVPHDVSVVGFDDIDLASWITPALTTVRQDRAQIALAGARLLCERIHRRRANLPHEDLGLRTETVSPRLIQRESSGRPAV